MQGRAFANWKILNKNIFIFPYLTIQLTFTGNFYIAIISKRELSWKNPEWGFIGFN